MNGKKNESFILQEKFREKQFYHKPQQGTIRGGGGGEERERERRIGIINKNLVIK